MNAPDYHTRQDGVRRTDTLEVEGGADIIVALVWTDAGFRLHINGMEIPANKASGESVSIYSPSIGQPMGLVFPNLDPDTGVSYEEKFFLSTLIDLDQRVVTGDHYSLMRAAGLLRQLLLDGLFNTVNRNHRVPIRFVTLCFGKPPFITFEAYWVGLDPNNLPGVQTLTCTVDEFLSAPCLYWQGTAANVKDLIKACANAKGGVHLGKTRYRNEELLLDWDKVVSIMGEEPSTLALRGISRITLVGLKDLVTRIIQSAGPKNS